jgi:hypothetical protein
MYQMGFDDNLNLGVYFGFISFIPLFTLSHLLKINIREITLIYVLGLTILIRSVKTIRTRHEKIGNRFELIWFGS